MLWATPGSGGNTYWIKLHICAYNIHLFAKLSIPPPHQALLPTLFPTLFPNSNNIFY